MGTVVSGVKFGAVAPATASEATGAGQEPAGPSTGSLEAPMTLLGSPIWTAERAHGEIVMFDAVTFEKRRKEENTIAIVFPFEGKFEEDGSWSFMNEHFNKTPLIMDSETTQTLASLLAVTATDSKIRLNQIICTGQHDREPFINLVQNMLEAKARGDL